MAYNLQKQPKLIMLIPTNQEVKHLVAMEEARAARADSKKKTTGQYLNKPQPVYTDLNLKTAIAREQTLSEDLTDPADFCYKKIAMSTAPGSTGYSKRLIMNCPVCNKTQFLSQYPVDYNYSSDFITRAKYLINLAVRAVTGRIPFALRGFVTIDHDIECQFNKLHRWRITKNQIQKA